MRKIICSSVLLFMVSVPLAAQENQMPFEWAKVRPVWQTEAVFQTPEAALYDAKRNVLYVSNHQVVDPPQEADSSQRVEFISKLDATGKILELKWVSDIRRPTGLAIHEDRLYVVERDNLTRIDMDKAVIEQRIPIVGADFANDIVFDSDGVGYISDNGQNGKTAIFRVSDGKTSPWLTADQIQQPNGLVVDGSDLVAYDNRRQALVRIDRATREIQVLAALASNAAAMGDGLVQLDEQTYLATAWAGPSWIVKKDGSVTPLLDTASLPPVNGQQVGNADSGLVPGKRLWIIPTFSAGRVLAYEFYE